MAYCGLYCCDVRGNVRPWVACSSVRVHHMRADTNVPLTRTPTHVTAPRHTCALTHVTPAYNLQDAPLEYVRPDDAEVRRGVCALCGLLWLRVPVHRHTAHDIHADSRHPGCTT